MKNFAIFMMVFLLFLAACAQQQVQPPALQPVVEEPPAPVSEAEAQEAVVEVEEKEASPTQGAMAESVPATPQKRVYDVQIKGFKFLPPQLTIKKGDVVRWTNMDSVPHTATGKGFDTGNLVKGQSGEVTFDKEGVYDYICTIHPYMKAQVTVQ